MNGPRLCATALAAAVKRTTRIGTSTLRPALDPLRLASGHRRGPTPCPAWFMVPGSGLWNARHNEC
jgi:hypothetical protein